MTTQEKKIGGYLIQPLIHNGHFFRDQYFTKRQVSQKLMNLKFIFCNENKNNIGLPIDLFQTI